MQKEPWIADETEDSDRSTTRLSGVRGCLYIGLITLIIISLLGTAVVTIIWLTISAREARVPAEMVSQNATAAETPTMPAAIAATASTPVSTLFPAEMEGQVSPAAEATIAADLPTAATGSAGRINRIVLVNGEQQLETIDPDGGNQRLLTNAPQQMFFQNPAWSPDGRAIAVIGSDLRGGGIYVLADEPASAAPAEDERYFSTLGVPFYLYWSPDSQYVSFLTNHPENRITLNLVPQDGTAESHVLANGSPLYWNWTADSQQLLLHNGRGGLGPRLTFIDLNGEEQTSNQVTPGPFQAPGISFDGRYWAFAEASNFGLASWLVVTDVAGNEQQRERHNGSIAMGWSPTANKLAFINGTAAVGGFWGPLRLLDLDTGELRVLTQETVLAFFWSPDGRSIAYISAELGGGGEIDVRASKRPLMKPAKVLEQVAVAGLRPSQRWLGRRPATAFQGNQHLRLSVVDVADGTGLQLLEFQPSLLFLAQFLPFFDQYALSHRLWSPDSDAVVLPIVQSGVNQIVIVPTSGGEPRPLAEGESAFWSHQ